eukprot:bmy_02918T0
MPQGTVAWTAVWAIIQKEGRIKKRVVLGCGDPEREGDRSLQRGFGVRHIRGEFGWEKSGTILPLSRGSRQVFRCLQKAPGQGDQGPHFPSHHVCHTKLQDQEHVTEVLHGAQFNFPGCQKIHVSKKRGFSKLNAGEFEALAAEKWLILDGFGVKYIPSDGAVDTW